MWNFFAREPQKVFPYEILDSYPSNPCSYCTLCRGVKKSGDKEPVTVFVCDKKKFSPECYELTKSLQRRLMTLRHPGIITYISSFEDDELLYIVTECVKPLLLHLAEIKEEEKNLCIPWGIMSIFKAVGFLNEDGKLRHNNLSAKAVFVSEAGLWKLGDLSCVTEIESSFPKKYGDTSRYDPPEITKSSAHPVLSCFRGIDSWGLGVFIWEVYNGEIYNTQQLKKISQIPSSLRPVYCEMVASRPEKRPSAISVLQRCSEHGEYFNNILIKTLTFLDEIHLKEKEEINIFFKDIVTVIDKIPKTISQNVILQQIVRAHEFGNEGCYLLPGFLKIAQTIEDDYEYQKKIVPFLTKMYNSNDRASRSILLQHLEQYIDKLSTTTINETLFPLIVNGFVDTNSRIREQTVKAMVFMVPKLHRKLVDDDVLRHLARLQSKDENGGIRTNTTVCLGKIAHCLHPSNRSAVLISAFLRSLHDPFAPVRNAGILALAVCQQYFSINDIGKRILPALCILTVDLDISVRENAFKTIKGFLGKLEKVSENPSLKEELEKELMSSSKGSAVGTWADWAVSAIASKFTSPQAGEEKKVSSKENISPEPPSSKEVSSAKSTKKDEKPETQWCFSPSALDDDDDDDSGQNASGEQEESGWDNESWLSLSDHEA